MARIHMQATLAVFATLLATTPVFADEALAGGDETFKFMVGGIFTRFDSNVRVDGTSENGSTIDLERGGLDKNAGNLLLSGRWRAGTRHRVSAMYFRSSRTGSRILEEDTEIGDTLLPAGSSLDSTAGERYLFANYAYSFVKTPDVEIAGVLGLYASRFTFDLVGTTTGATPRSFTYQPSATVPLPLLGASVDWYIMPRLQLGASLTGLKARIGDIDGSVWLLSAGAEYMIARNFGVGLSFLHTGVNVEVTKPRFNGVIDWNSNNLLFYALARF